MKFAGLPLIFQLAACFIMNSVAQGRLCLQHEEAVLHPRHDYGSASGHLRVDSSQMAGHEDQVPSGGHEEVGPLSRHLAPINVSALRLVSCPIYSQCCSSNDPTLFNTMMTEQGACCFDYPWLWSSLSVLFLIFSGLAVLFFLWQKKMRVRNQLAEASARTRYLVQSDRAGGDIAVAMPMSSYTTLNLGDVAPENCKPLCPVHYRAPAFPPTTSGLNPPTAPTLAPPPYSLKREEYEVRTVETQTTTL